MAQNVHGKQPSGATATGVNPVLIGGVDASGNIIAQKIGASGYLPGELLVEQLTQADAVAGVLTFDANLSYVEIYNTSNTSGTFEINGITLNVPANTSFKAAIGGAAAKTVTVTSATSYIVSRYV